MWIMFAFIAFALISIFSIPPTFLKKGVSVTSVESNTSIYDSGLRQNMVITSINNQQINNLQDYSNIINNIKNTFIGNETQKVTIQTNKIEIIGLFKENFSNDLNVQNIPKTRIITGSDLQGGIQALVSAENHSLTTNELNDLISVTQERLNVYGLSDVNVKPVSDSDGNNFMSVEIAGASPSNLENLISQQGNFEAKIGNETVFIGGNKDITFVASSGQDVYIQCPQKTLCQFYFAITLSPGAATRQAILTQNLTINASSGGRYLSKTLDLYLDGKKIDSLNIGIDLKGREVTNIEISGAGTGADQEESYNDAKENMKKLQTILKTGSLPFKLQIDSLNRTSPNLGKGFINTILIAGLLAFIGVFAIVLIRYKKIKLSFVMIFVMASEILIILGIAALIHWNLNLASIAGIIAAIGTGVDDQIVIVDETKRSKSEPLKRRIKSALFIIFTAYATSVVSLLPLLNAGAGLLKGFAVTTLIGITTGVFITRPAFADIVRQLEE